MNYTLSEKTVSKTPIYLLLISAMAGSAILFLVLMVSRLEWFSACSSWGACLLELGSGSRSGLIRLASSVAPVLIPLAWGFNLIPIGIAAWELRSRPRVSASLFLVLLLLSVVFVVRSGLFAALNLTLPSGFDFGLVLISQGIIIAILVWAGAGIWNTLTTGESVSDVGLRSVSRLGLYAWGSLLITFLVLISGALISINHLNASCAGWPLCQGSIPGLARINWIMIGHWSLVGVGAVMIGILFIQSWRYYAHDMRILLPATALIVLYIAQMVIGAVDAVRIGDQPLLDGLHALASTGVWTLIVVFLIQASIIRGPAIHEKPKTGTNRTLRKRLDFLLLTKPIIVLLLLLTTYAGMVVAGGRLPGVSLVFWTLLAGGLAAGGSSAINQYIDRNRDQLMVRTANRPIASGRISAAEGLAFGVALCLASFFIMAIFVNLLAAILSLVGIIYYVYFYSILLKDSTDQNIVIGGGAGAIPPLVGWAAVTNHLTLAALMLFVVIFFWTPPHFWALALVRKKDYARAGVPMLPVVRGEDTARRQIFIYTIVLVLITLTLPAFNLGGWVYWIGALLLGLWLISCAWKLLQVRGNKVAWKMYRYSSMYLAFLFMALVVDVLVR